VILFLDSRTDEKRISKRKDEKERKNSKILIAKKIDCLKVE